MKLSFIVLLILFMPSLIRPQNAIDYKTYNQSAGVLFITGISSFNLDEGKKMFNLLTESYIRQNIPVKTQELYPMNTLWGGGFYYFPARSISLNLGLEFTNTSAYSLYGDRYGTLDLKSKMSLTYLYAGTKYHFMEVPYVQPFAGVQAGYMFGVYNTYTKKHIYNDPAWERNVDISASGYLAELFIGASYNLDLVILDIQGGYRFSKVSNNDLKYPPDFSGDINTSGTNVKLSIRTGVYW